MKKIKSIWMYVMVFVLSVAMMIGSFNLVAIADAVPFENGSQLVNGSVTTKVKLGDTFGVPAGSVTVTAPNGSLVNINNGKVTAEQLGNYIVSYKATVNEPEKELDYSYAVHCYEDTEYFIYVSGNGSIIPTYIETGKEFDVPDYYLAYRDEDDNIVKAENQSVKVVITSGTINEGKIKTVTAGTMYVTLNACIGDMDSATKIYTKEFKVNVQNTFKDIVSPTLTVVNVPTAGNINAKVTLPKATATDDFDENISFEVKVIDPDGNPVKNVVLNNYGYVESVASDDVKFDNIDVVDFYPTKEGTYTSTFQAIDDAGNKSSVHTYYTEVKDKLAPVIYDIADDKIPTNWGLSVENKEGMLDDFSVVFPFPVLVDNQTLEDDLTLTFTLQCAARDSDKTGTTVLKFSDKVSAYKKGLEMGSDYAKYFKDGTKLTFAQEGLKLDFNAFKYGSDSEILDEDDMFGDWTVTYTVKDEAGYGNTGTAKKTYTINLSNAFEDVDAPNIDEIVVPSYLMVGVDDESEFTVPALVAADSKDTRLTLNYRISSDATFEAGLKVQDYIVVEMIDVDGGETMKVISENGAYFLGVTINNYDYALKLSDNFKLTYSATDDAGNKTEIFEETVDVLYAGNVSGQTLDITMNITPEGKAGTTVDLGGFTVSGVEHREYTGFEITLKDYNGEILSGLDLYTYYNKAGDTMYVKNITFQPAKGGIYELYIKIFDITGKSNVYAYAVDIKDKNSNNENSPTAASMPTTGAVREAYELKTKTLDEEITSEYTDNVMVYRLNGGSFSLMGYEFTALNQTKYSFTEMYMSFGSEDIESAHYYNYYSLSANDEDVPVIEVQGIMPSHVETTATVTKAGVYKAGEYVELPAIVAYNGYANADIDVTVKDRDGSKVNAYQMYKNTANEYTFEKEGNSATGKYAFSATKDGNYTVTVNAYVGGISAAPKDYIIKVGDVTGPEFTILTDSAPGKAVVGDTFTFRNIDNVTDNNDSNTKINVTAKLYDPSTAEVTDVALSKSWFSWKDDDDVTKTTYKFTKSGTYTVEYKVSDSRGNTTTQKYTIVVSAKSSKTPVSLVALSTVLIIVAVLLIAGLIIYFVRFRKVKK